MYTLSRFGVRVPLNSLSDEEKKTIVSDLIITPIPSEYEFNSIKYKVYSESKNNLYLPRNYREKYHPLVLPSYDSISVRFEGTLKESTKQVSASSTILKELRERTGTILSLPTGYGKTTVALYVASHMAMKTLIIVHKEFLLNQWIEKIQQFLPTARIGKIQGDVIDVNNKDIVIGMLQSLSSKDYPAETFEGFGLTIIDETHHICTRTFSRVFSKFNTAYVLGLSATLERKDGLTYVIHYFLGQVGYFAERKNQTKVTVKTVRITHQDPFPMNNFGKPNMSEAITMLTEMKHRNDTLLSVVLDVNRKRKILILTDRRNHCSWLCDTLCAGGLDAGIYMGGMKVDELKKNESKSIIVGTYSLAHEGLDIPSLDCILLATPKSNVIQAVGRILRETHGKQFDPLVIDLIDLWGPFNHQYKKRKAYYVDAGFTLDSEAKIQFQFQTE